MPILNVCLVCSLSSAPELSWRQWTNATQYLGRKLWVARLWEVRGKRCFVSFSLEERGGKPTEFSGGVGGTDSIWNNLYGKNFCCRGKSWLEWVIFWSPFIEGELIWKAILMFGGVIPVLSLPQTQGKSLHPHQICLHVAAAGADRVKEMDLRFMVQSPPLPYIELYALTNQLLPSKPTLFSYNVCGEDFTVPSQGRRAKAGSSCLGSLAASSQRCIVSRGLFPRGVWKPARNLSFLNSKLIEALDWNDSWLAAHAGSLFLLKMKWGCFFFFHLCIQL